MAALLKLILSRPSIYQHLEFELAELLSELQWQDNSNTRQQVEASIGSYVRLLYDKRVDVRAVRRTAAAGGGYYHLITAYFRRARPDTNAAIVKTLRNVYFDRDFIEGLRRGRVYFAGNDFGPLKTTD